MHRSTAAPRMPSAAAPSPSSSYRRGLEAPMDVDVDAAGGLPARHAFATDAGNWLSRLQRQAEPAVEQPPLAMDVDSEGVPESDCYEQHALCATSVNDMDVEEQTAMSSSLAVKGDPPMTPRRTASSTASLTASRQQHRGKTSATSTGVSWDTLAERLHQLPHLIYNWANLMYNLLVLFVVGFFLWKTACALWNDYQFKFDRFQRDILIESEQCAQSYRDNRCAPETRVPAMQGQCMEWDKCMNRDPAAIAGTMISARILAEILESFVSSLSYKTMLFMALLVCMTVFMKWMLGGLTSAAPTVPRTKASTPRRRISGQLSRTPRGALQQSSTSPSHPPAYIPPYDGAMQFGAVAFQPVLLDFSSANTSRVGSGSMRQPHHMRIGRSRSLSVVRRPYYDGDDQMAYATRDAMHGDCTQDTSDRDEDSEGAEDEMGAE